MVDEEAQGPSTPVGGRPVDVGEELAEAGGSERVAAGGGMTDERDRSERVAEDVEMEEEEAEGEFVKIDKATRTDTEGTLVAGDDDDDEKGKFEFELS